ncbi:low-specificity L-threonine aldolase [Sporomusa sp.]|uniref:low-specificity L-threonine aldolase n=1 Tax=Sporomusa sp. TaxID=2078658 RepID=UPI002C25DDCE|nr:low-specificity L-threonine aldolase [Sporomusa sp.]HWR45346.1 low-specificity L-threonine aldolase [Sporomusa sp.]
MLRFVDLRSDTVTMPTPQMREAMYRAEVGDDVYGEDPTVRELEELGARMTGKEASLFVTSGTMGNQLAILAHTQRGDEIICESDSHIFFYEVGGIAALAGVQARTIPGNHGVLTPELISAAIRPRDIHQPPTSLICLENTHNRAGGVSYPIEVLSSIYTLCKNNNIQLHTDGARIFNAAVRNQVSVDKLTCYTDSVMFCLSKGLCAPVGSLLAGSQEFIEKCRRYRKMLGGGMRQAGIIAAAGIVALNSMVERLNEDHDNARLLANAIANMDIGFNPNAVQTNIVVVDTTTIGKTAAELAARLADQGIKISQFGDYKIRMVTHHGITGDDIEYTINTLASTVKG